MNRASSRQIVMGLMLSTLSSVVGANTLYVNPAVKTDGDNQFGSITAALAHLKVGDTMLLADGLYRESIDLRRLATPASFDGRHTVIAASKNAHPIIKGSLVVEGWQSLGEDVYVHRDWPVNSQQVFLNGKALKQIGGQILGGFPLDPRHAFAKLHATQGGIWPGRSGNGRQDLVAESFYYDASTKNLFIKTTSDITASNIPTRNVIEVSTRPYLVIANGLSGLELRGLTFEHANTSDVSQSGAISLQGNHLLLSRLTMRLTDGACLDVTGDDNRIENSSANYCGSVGMKVRGHRALLKNNETNFNNTRGFNKWWEAGGAKFVGAGGLQDSEVTGHRAYANNGDGIWFDWRNNNNRIHHNVVAYNHGMGIHYEASFGAKITNNYVVGNTQRGIYLPNSSHSTVENNLVAANQMEAIAIVDERHAVERGPAEFVPNDNKVLGNVVAWNGKASIVLPAKTKNISNANLLLGVAEPAFSVDWQPLLQGLQNWRAREQQDSQSTWQSMPLPAFVEHAIATDAPLSAAQVTQWQQLLQSLTTGKEAVAVVSAALAQLNLSPVSLAQVSVQESLAAAENRQ